MSDTETNQALLCRQPILDQQESLVGYEISLQPPVDTLVHDGSRAALLVCAAYADLGLRSALGQSVAFLQVDLDFLHDDAIEALPPEGVVLELVLDNPADERTLERCRALRERGYSLALADYTGLDDRSRGLLSMLDVIKIDIGQFDEIALAELAGALVRLPLKLLAQGVETQAEMQRCQKIGFKLFQGQYFAHPEIVSGRRLSASQTSLIQLINLAGRNTDTFTIEAAIKREPALAVNLLRIVNSVGYGVARRISSLQHAITMLGRRQLQRWLQLLLMTPAGQTPDTSRSPLLQVAALRGRMLEMLIELTHPRDRQLADQAFITGIMSMMPAALGLPMTEIFAQISLEPEIVEALSTHSGALGNVLALLECFDAQDDAGCDAALANFSTGKLTRDKLNHCLAESLRWVNGNTEEA